MHYLIGVFLVLISGSSFGTLAIFARLAYEDGVTPITLLFLRFGIASLCMLLIMWLRRIPIPRGWVLLALALMGGIGYVGQALSYFTALTLIPAGLVALLLYLYPAIVTILAVIILRERISKWKRRRRRAGPAFPRRQFAFVPGQGLNLEAGSSPDGRHHSPRS